MLKRSRNTALVLVTAPNLKVARQLSRMALEQRLIACANLVPALESHYRWKGKIDKASEVLLLLKTTHSKVARLENLIRAKHPYETPEFIVVAAPRVAEKYLKWWLEETASPKE